MDPYGDGRKAFLIRRRRRELLPMARTYGIATIPWSPLAGGLLTGKYHRGEAPPTDSRYGNARPDSPQARRMQERAFDVTEALEPLASGKGVTMSQFALAWVLHQPGVTSPIIGPRTMEQFEDNLKALDVTINDEDRQKIDATIPPGTNVAPFYEANFGPHLYR
jgi:aryl-alcohol dehydrogenase-like predicted oxidoreductase